MIYVAIAYRWDSTNAHQYIVAAGTDADKVCAIAEQECFDRGGKYGVAVYEIADSERRDEASNFRIIEYHPPMLCGREPRNDYRQTAIENLGHEMWSKCKHGEIKEGLVYESYLKHLKQYELWKDVQESRSAS